MIVLSSFSFAQERDQEEIDLSLSKYDLVVNWPVELKTKIQKFDKKAFSPEGMSIYYPSEKIQIIIEVDLPDSASKAFPNLENGLRLAHYSSNEEDSIISLHTLGTKELESLNAEWGTQSFFRPKKEFADYQFCQLISFYTCNMAQVFVYYLFNDTENPLLERSFDLIQYSKR